MCNDGSVSLIQITELSGAELRQALDAALERDGDPSVVAEFTASVDWSGWEGAPAELRELLGKLEAWTVEVDVGGMQRAEYKELLQNALASRAARVN